MAPKKAQGKRKMDVDEANMDQKDESAEKQKKVEIKEELCDRCSEKESLGVWEGKKWCSTCAKRQRFLLTAVAECKIEDEAAAMKAAKAAIKKAKKAKDDLELKKKCKAAATTKLDSFLGAIGLEKHDSELEGVTKIGYGYRSEVGDYSTWKEMNEKDIENVLALIIAGATETSSGMNFDVEKDGWRLIIKCLEDSAGNARWKGRQDYQIQIETNGKTIFGEKPKIDFDVDVEIFDCWHDKPKEEAELFFDDDWSETVGEGKERVKFYVEGHKVGGDEDHRLLINITMN
ncbi:Oidioi.mRNA.OKI2018_I69.XSR.g13960.t1.cds [Oikopleura dioica]|uniref:Oidioi.mRNA.OKI2018_I69.XSR.g13960.t1.cds n=1 Tax=Oikopleura dioica TaxID=34765 RepID=A0ABN7SH32_OIKDI|nr:Oidioi.mRNA.OKI2018_I69.XSR.g13960.t1.cds [Oikopleura dioica]